MKFLAGFSLEMTLVLDSKSTVSTAVSPSVCVHVCLSVSTWCPLGVTRDVHGPDEADLSGVCAQSVRPRVCVYVCEK